MAHAVDEEPVLLAHDLGSHFQDGPGPLVEAAREPVGVLQALRQKILFGLVPGAA